MTPIPVDLQLHQRCIFSIYWKIHMFFIYDRLQEKVLRYKDHDQFSSTELIVTPFSPFFILFVCRRPIDGVINDFEDGRTFMISSVKELDRWIKFERHPRDSINTVDVVLFDETTEVRQWVMHRLKSAWEAPEKDEIGETIYAYETMAGHWHVDSNVGAKREDLGNLKLVFSVM